MAKAVVPGRFEGTISPLIWVVRLAASTGMSAASITLNRAQASVAPISSFVACTMSSPRALSESAAVSSLARRSPGPVAAQPGEARAAASTARAAPPRVPAPTAARRRPAAP